MSAFDGPIVEASDAQGATIANAAAQNLPGVAEIVSILPNHIGHVAEVAWLAIEQPEGNEPPETADAIFLDVMRGHW